MSRKKPDTDGEFKPAANDSYADDHVITEDGEEKKREKRHATTLLEVLDQVAPKKKKKTDSVPIEGTIDGSGEAWTPAETAVLLLLINGCPPTPIPRGNFESMFSFAFRVVSHFSSYTRI